MKFLHLADLHIGKRVNGFSMIEDQKYILDQILQLAAGVRPDGVLIAGDVYDKAIPSEEAVRLLDRFLVELLKVTKDVFLISGNHDSAERVTFGSRIMDSQGLHIAPVYDGRICPFVLQKGEESVTIWPIPFLKPSDVRRSHENADPADYQEAMKLVLNELALDPSVCNIAIVHQFLTGGSVSESEESIGSLANVDAALFDDFDYVALGHLHGPQKVGRETARYAGSPLKYSFSEYDQKKSVTLVETKGKSIAVSLLPLTPLHEMQKIRGSFAEITDPAFYEHYNRQDYMMITLTDEQDIPNAGARLRSYYPQWMILQYDNSRTRQEEEVLEAALLKGKSEITIFEELFRKQNGKEMDEEQKSLIMALLAELKGESDETC